MLLLLDNTHYRFLIPTKGKKTGRYKYQKPRGLAIADNDEFRVIDNMFLIKEEKVLKENI
ncbi:hypothetical protein AI29_06040 [bacteria symbiont BFo2 of Frankliniella occidentalis]|nr:hypothetical protein AI29_06040 [bacteria symbiont BFo2 of Frankliniella occidentalis]KYP96592.1 hypothetical protein WB67_02545 [bacteria symbiont BFo2 of Frankliniella occidentalis]